LLNWIVNPTRDLLHRLDVTEYSTGDSQAAVGVNTAN